MSGSSSKRCATRLAAVRHVARGQDDDVVPAAGDVVALLHLRCVQQASAKGCLDLGRSDLSSTSTSARRTSSSARGSSTAARRAIDRSRDSGGCVAGLRWARAARPGRGRAGCGMRPPGGARAARGRCRRERRGPCAQHSCALAASFQSAPAGARLALRHDHRSPRNRVQQRRRGDARVLPRHARPPLCRRRRRLADLRAPSRRARRPPGG